MDSALTAPPRGAMAPPLRLAAGAALLGAGTLLFLFDPAASGIFPPCPFHALTGLYCPGCGSLRALHQLFHGNVLAALGLNPLMVLSLPFILYSLVAGGLSRRGVRLLPVYSLRSWQAWSILVLVVIYGLARNLPLYPFSLLAP